MNLKQLELIHWEACNFVELKQACYHAAKYRGVSLREDANKYDMIYSLMDYLKQLKAEVKVNRGTVAFYDYKGDVSHIEEVTGQEFIFMVEQSPAYKSLVKLQQTHPRKLTKEERNQKDGGQLYQKFVRALENI